MYFRQIVDEQMGCASYLVGSTAAGLAAVIDPAWDVGPYIDLANERGMQITHAIDTHPHADHVSGIRSLAAATGAQICLHPAFAASFPFRALSDGEQLGLGEVELRIMHAPGHRPENLAILVADTARASEPWLVLTGDSLFVGDVARPDLTVDSAESARGLYQTLHERLLLLHDGTELYPSHVGGSLCGKAMSFKPNSTIGFERRFNGPLAWRPEQTFIERLLADLPPRPPNLDVIVRKNLGELEIRAPVPRALAPAEVQALFDGGCVIVDLRDPEPFGQAHLPEALNIPLTSPRFGSSAGWSIPPEEPIILVLDNPEQLHRGVAQLATVGLDWIEGYLAGGIQAWLAEERPVGRQEQVSVARLHELLRDGAARPVVVDVREPGEWSEGHIPEARNIRYGELLRRAGELPRGQPLAIVCPGGYVSSVAVSQLLGLGFEQVANVAGGMLAWRQAGYETVAEGANAW